MRSGSLPFTWRCASRFCIVLYLTGRGETLLGIAIPIFDGPALSAIVFTALLAFRYQESSTSAVHKLLWMALAAASYLIVLLCFRRTYWGELAIGTVILLLLQQRRRLRNFALVGTMLCLAAVTLGKPFAARVQKPRLHADGQRIRRRQLRPPARLAGRLGPGARSPR